MSVRVVIPWRGGDPHRTAVLDWVQDQWARHHPDWEIWLGELTRDSDWCKADAVQTALDGVAPDDILVIADADVWSDTVGYAVDAVASGEYRWAIPHSQVLRLNQETTRQVIEEGRIHNAQVAGCLDRAGYLGVVGGGITIVTADLYAECPLDPRFVGWGQEDESWGHALHALGGRRWRGAQPLWHLWHPPQERMSQAVGSVHGQRLAAEYRRLVSSPTLMRQLIEGGRPHSSI
jgi:hypothetical protein